MTNNPYENLKNQSTSNSDQVSQSQESIPTTNPYKATSKQNPSDPYQEAKKNIFKSQGSLNISNSGYVAAKPTQLGNSSYHSNNNPTIPTDLPSIPNTSNLPTPSPYTDPIPSSIGTNPTPSDGSSGYSSPSEVVIRRETLQQEKEKEEKAKKDALLTKHHKTIKDFQAKLKKLDPLDEDRRWFEQFATNYTHQVDAIIDYLGLD